MRSASDVAPGDVLHVRVRDARVDATVTGVEPLGEPDGTGTRR